MCKGVFECLIMCKSVLECLIMCIIECVRVFYHVLECAWVFDHVQGCAWVFDHVQECAWVFDHVQECAREGWKRGRRCSRRRPPPCLQTAPSHCIKMQLHHHHPPHCHNDRQTILNKVIIITVIIISITTGRGSLARQGQWRRRKDDEIANKIQLRILFWDQGAPADMMRIMEVHF